MERSDPALMEFFGSLQSEGGSSVPAPARPARDEADVLLDRVIMEESEALHQGFLAGAEFAVTRMESVRERVLHRLECSVLEPQLDRRVQWTESRRKRLLADHSYRLPLPTLVTRDAAQHLTPVRSCKVCWPNVHGNEPRPLRKLQARGLRAQHVGHVFATSGGDSLGTIVSTATRSAGDDDGHRRECVEVVTSWHTLEYAPSDAVYIWDLPTDTEAIERKMRLFARLGSDLNPAN